MPDIDPAALSRPANLSTPVITTKTLNLSGAGTVKISKSQVIPQRIDLEPLYTALKAAISPEHWLPYKEAATEFLIGIYFPCHWMAGLGGSATGLFTYTD